MPADLLTIAFALTLVVNALFVVVAIRALRPGHHGADGAAVERDVTRPPLRQAGPGAVRRDQPDVVRAVAARRAALGDAESRPEAAVESTSAPGPAAAQARADRAPAVEPEATTSQAAEPVPVASKAVEPEATTSQAAEPVPVASKAVEPEAVHMSPLAERLLAELEAARAARDPATGARVDAHLPSAARPRSPGASEESPRAGAPGPASETDRRSPTKARGKGRRKFSLPPLDEDHEKVSRSIESFLAGGDPMAEGGAGGSSGSAGGAATTVALIAVVGAGDDPVDGNPAAAIVERTLRSAARATDVVEVADGSRFRIVLSGTGELAARAYLRRVRATVEPLLEAADTPLRLVIATATVLDEPAETAASVAARRLELALAAAATDGTDDETSAPRAAAD
ncbi:MAG TPA: hypothetical protein VFK35_02110 [Candidatus Limnocylindrales bacterium]|nr:hypothetical protein [Candidatus Limnocylindrales bacterium]